MKAERGGNKRSAYRKTRLAGRLAGVTARCLSSREFHVEVTPIVLLEVERPCGEGFAAGQGRVLGERDAGRRRSGGGRLWIVALDV